MLASIFSPSKTTLNDASVSDSDVAITITSVSGLGWPASGTVLIDKEQMIYSSITGNTVLNLSTRGANGTTAAAHTTNGVPVYLVETSLVSFSIADEVDIPMFAEIVVSNKDNARSSTYTDLMEVYIVNGDTGLILHRGKIVKKKNNYDMQYGRTLVIQTRDNLQELSKRNVRTDKTYSTSGTKRSTVIQSIINDHRYSSSSIDTSVIDTGVYTSSVLTSSGGTLDYGGNTRSVLSAIFDLASQDPHASAPGNFGYDFFLDPNDNKFYYFKRGTLPASGSSLVCQFGATQDAFTRSMFPGFDFGDESKEIITAVSARHRNAAGDYITRYFHLINVDDKTGLSTGTTLTADYEGDSTSPITVASITDFPASGTIVLDNGDEMPEIITYVGKSGSTLGSTSVTRGSSNSYGTTNQAHFSGEKVYLLLVWPSGAAIGDQSYAQLEKIGDDYIIISNPKLLTEHTHTEVPATGVEILQTTATGAMSPLVSRSATSTYDIFTEATLNLNEYSSYSEIVDKAAEILQHSDNTIVRGTFQILGWPYYDRGAGNVNIRAGHEINVVNSELGINLDMIVSKIDYGEGPGRFTATIEVYGVERGRPGFEDRNLGSRLNEVAQGGNWQSGLAAGSALIGQQFCEFTPEINLRVDSSPNNDDTILWDATWAKFSDGSSMKINSGSVTVTNDNIWWLYIADGNSTVQSSDGFNGAIGLGKHPFAILKRKTDGTDADIVVTHMSDPVLKAGTIIANHISALSADMGLLNAGEIRATSSGTWPGTFTGWRLSASDVELAAFNSGSRTVVFDELGISVLQTSSSGTTPTLRFFSGGTYPDNAQLRGRVYATTASHAVTGVAGEVRFDSPNGGGFPAAAATYYLGEGDVVLGGSANYVMPRVASASIFGHSSVPWNLIYSNALEFPASASSSLAGGDYGIARNLSASLDYNVPTSKSHLFNVNGTTYFGVASSALTVNADIQGNLHPSASNTYYIGSGSSDYWVEAWLGLLRTNGIKSKDNGSGVLLTDNVTNLAFFGTGGISLYQATTVTGGLLPVSSGTYDLGSSSLWWNTLFIGQQYSKITGSSGDMEFYIGDGASGTTLAMSLTDGTARTLTLASGTLLNFTSTGSATAGATALPANAVGFVAVKVGGTEYRIPYYNT